jgi:hypothetical protein
VHLLSKNSASLPWIAGIYHFNDLSAYYPLDLMGEAAEMKGIDVDFAFLPIDTLTVRGGFEIMSSHYTNFRNAPFFRPTSVRTASPWEATHRAWATGRVLMPSERPKKLRI